MPVMLVVVSMMLFHVLFIFFLGSKLYATLLTFILGHPFLTSLLYIRSVPSYISMWLWEGISMLYKRGSSL